METRIENREMKDKINEMIRKIEAVNGDIAYYEAQGNDFMVKAEIRRRAGYRARLTRLHKMMGHV